VKNFLRNTIVIIANAISSKRGLTIADGMCLLMVLLCEL
jgi:hypothetical protein